MLNCIKKNVVVNSIKSNRSLNGDLSAVQSKQEVICDFKESARLGSFAMERACISVG